MPSSIDLLRVTFARAWNDPQSILRVPSGSIMDLPAPLARSLAAEGFVTVTPAATEAPSFGPVAYVGTWASKPAANAVPVGTVIEVTDVGPGAAGRTRWYSDGTYYRPVGGMQLVEVRSGSVATPVATLTGNGAAQVFTLPKNILIPGGMLFPGSQLEVLAYLHKAGTHAGTFQVGIGPSASPATPANENITTQASNAANPSANKSACRIGIYSGGWVQPGSAGTIFNGVSGAVPYADKADANINTADRYVHFSLGASYADSAANLIHYTVAVLG